MPQKSKIYLDHAATTPLDPKVFKAMTPYLKGKFGNPSSIHSFGQETRRAIDEARDRLAKFLNCQSKEIIFTSGATESNNLAIRGVSLALKAKGGKHIITSSIEHPAVLETCGALSKDGFKITYLPVTPKGLIKVEDVQKAIRPDTFLVTIIYVNNEVGIIQPIREIGKLIEKVNRTRKLKIIFHTDAVQAINYCHCNVDWLHVDLLSLSGHKIYGPKGIGALYFRLGTPIRPIQSGGHHEFGLRPGTENVAAIVGLGKAIELVKKRSRIENKKIASLRDRLIKGILQKIPGSQLNGDRNLRVPSNANFSFPDVEGESLLLMLDMEKIAVSTGSACSSGSLEPSHVLTAMGIPSEISHGSLRITLGKDNTPKEIDKVLKVLPQIIRKLRKMSPLKS